MKFAPCFTILLLFANCNKPHDTVVRTDSSQFVLYSIKSGEHYSDKSEYKPVETKQLTFAVKFDSSAVYQTQNSENQYDINKLYGFSDNNAQHHQFSARIGWRWSDGALTLFGYVYNNGQLSSTQLATVTIGTQINCSITVEDSLYVFKVNNNCATLPRSSTTPKAEGYMLYPYFGGDEVAPHDVKIWIRNL
ncbi:MAG: hypothetical protein ICV66_01285 [Chitinophagaceae bacterium]|nr:hypothetical protein [Chitinophagaceae bacterium]